MRYTSSCIVLFLSTLFAVSATCVFAQHPGAKKPAPKAGISQGKISGKRDTLILNAEHSQHESATQAYGFVEQMPSFPGDLPAFLSQHLKYPDAALANHIEGRVVVEFIVRKDGSLTDAKVIRSVSKDLDAESLRVIGLMPHWKPGRQNGQAVDVWYVLPFTFEPD